MIASFLKKRLHFFGPNKKIAVVYGCNRKGDTRKANPGFFFLFLDHRSGPAEMGEAIKAIESKGAILCRWDTCPVPPNLLNSAANSGIGLTELSSKNMVIAHAISSNPPLPKQPSNGAAKPPSTNGATSGPGKPKPSPAASPSKDKKTSGKATPKPVHFPQRTVFSWDPLDPQSNPYTAHLFSDHKSSISHAFGTASLPWGLNSEREHVAQLIRHKSVVAPFQNPAAAEAIDVFYTWGLTDNPAQHLAIGLAQLRGKPHVMLEYGFISSFGLAVNGWPQLSIIANTGTMYYDAHNICYLEALLSNPDFSLSNDQHIRAQSLIKKIVDNNITKYNHVPPLDLAHLKTQLATQKICLLVDQRFGDKSVASGMGSESLFEKMIDNALSLDKQWSIIAKVHPDAISGGKDSYLSKFREKLLNSGKKVLFLAEDVNPIQLLRIVDRVSVCTSQLGFEALILGKDVHCYGVPWYSGWGLTTDVVPMPRPRRTRSVEELFFAAYVTCSTYVTPGQGVCELETLIDYIVALRPHVRANEKFIPRSEPRLQPALTLTDMESVFKHIRRNDATQRVLFVLASNAQSATGRYVQDLAVSLRRRGCESMILADGQFDTVINGIPWKKIEFDGIRLSDRLREAIVRFSPTIVYENGIRSRAMRAGLEAVFLTNSKFAMQFEDDDIQVCKIRQPEISVDQMTIVDYPNISVSDVAKFLRENNWEHSLRVFMDPDYDRWIEPILRAMCTRLAGLHTAIWEPYRRRLAKEYNKETLVVPPGIPIKSYSTKKPSADERGQFFDKHGFDPSSLLVYLGGTVYDYSEEYSLFLDFIKELIVSHNQKISFAVVNHRTRLAVGDMARTRLEGLAPVVELIKPNDDEYGQFLFHCDIVASPGIPDRFTYFRLPSRLVKAMAMGKVILTSDYGFGESLISGKNAILTTGMDPQTWAQDSAKFLNPERIALIGAEARKFAEENFDINLIADKLFSAFARLTSVNAVSPEKSSK